MLWPIIQGVVKTLGPLAVPYLQKIIESRPNLTPEQKAKLEALIAALLGGQKGEVYEVEAE